MPQPTYNFGHSLLHLFQLHYRLSQRIRLSICCRSGSIWVPWTCTEQDLTQTQSLKVIGTVLWSPPESSPESLQWLGRIVNFRKATLEVFRNLCVILFSLFPFSYRSSSQTLNCSKDWWEQGEGSEATPRIMLPPVQRGLFPAMFTICQGLESLEGGFAGFHAAWK